ncbi:hypothetical protein M885DRAFT_517816 [Pelagophyceae sp. CCMP2097]|nr:hypothetical protein M885DRAFT_517816 [Pelagophyceae sp. CCMP2097]
MLLDEAARHEPNSPAGCDDVPWLRGRIAQLENEKQCKQCARRPRNALVLPCLHLAYCAQCARATDRCPICNVVIAGVLEVRAET